MAGTAVRFANPYGGNSASTIYEVDQANKTLKPYGSGGAFTGAGYQFGQERVVSDPNEFSGYSVGPIINDRAAALAATKSDLNNFQNEQFQSSQQPAPQRASATLQERIDSGTKAIDDQMAEYAKLTEKYKALQDPNYEKSFNDARTAAGIPALEQQYADVRQTRREMPYVQRAQTGNAGVATEGQLQDKTAQADIPLGIQEQNTLDRLNLASDYVNHLLTFKQADAATAREAITNAISLVTGAIDMQRTSLSDAKAEKDKQQSREDQSLQFRLENGITTPFFNVGGTIYDSGSLEGIPDEKAFQQKYGISLQDAEAKGLVGKLDAGAQQSKGLVLDLAGKYPDAGILPSDTLQAAQAKLKSSRIYQEQVRPPQYASGGGSGGGTLSGSPIVDKNIDAGVRSIIASKPGDGGYGAAYEAVKAKYGEAVAKSYDRVYQDVFNNHTSVDAAFNNAKLGSTGMVDASGKPVKLSDAMKSTIADWNTLSDLASQTLTLGDRIGFKGTGGGYQGSIQQFLAKNFGQGSQEEEQLRNMISNIQGTISKARAGTALSKQELEILQGYTPTINDSPLVIKSKLANLQAFIQTTTSNIYRAAGIANVGGDTVTQADGSVWQKNQDGSYTQIK